MVIMESQCDIIRFVQSDSWGFPSLNDCIDRERRALVPDSRVLCNPYAEHVAPSGRSFERFTAKPLPISRSESPVIAMGVVSRLGKYP